MKKAPMPGGLVLIKPIGSHMEPYTTADTVAQYAQVRHKTVNELIRKHEADLKEFGLLRFEMEACPHRTGASVQKIYHLNEQQATLLITYLRNTEPVRQFKKPPGNRKQTRLWQLWPPPAMPLPWGNCGRSIRGYCAPCSGSGTPATGSRQTRTV